MSKSSNIEKIANRIAGAIGKSFEALLKAAKEYSKEMKVFGEDLENAMIKRGFERSWLKVFQATGEGLVDIRILSLAPEKQQLLSNITIGQQRKLLNKGLDGHPISEVAMVTLRKFISGMPSRYRQVLSEEFHWVSSHTRQPPRRRPPARVVVTEKGLRVAKHLITWADLVAALKDAVRDKLIPRGPRASLRALFRGHKK